MCVDKVFSRLAGVNLCVLTRCSAVWLDKVFSRLAGQGVQPFGWCQPMRVDGCVFSRLAGVNLCVLTRCSAVWLVSTYVC